jgi:hypothetical protein
MSAELDAVLASLDPNVLRTTPETMRSAVNAVAGVSGDVWTGPWPTVVERLRDVASVDLCLGRLVEGHADALRILDQAGAEPQPGTYGVWASRSAGTGLAAEASPNGDWQLKGQLRFASGIDVIDRALVPGWSDPEHHFLFDVPIDLFEADRGSWATAAMDASRSFTCWANALAAGEPIGGEDFYLSRPGFVAGGLGPAAVWAGGAHLVADAVAAGLGRFPSQAHQRRRLGTIIQAVWAADAAVHRGAAILEGDGDGSPRVGAEISHVRTAVVQACDVVLSEAPLIVGPGGLSTDRQLARGLADLAIYIRQHHLDLTLEGYGAAVLPGPDPAHR